MNAFTALIRNDLVLYFGNRRALLMNLIAPIVIAAFFGSLFGGSDNKKPSRIPIAIVDQDDSALTKKIVAGMKNDTTFAVTETAEADALDQVRKGKQRAAVVFPAGFGEAAPGAMFRPGAKPVIRLAYDPSQAMVLAVVRGMLAQHVMQNVAQTAFGGTAGDLKWLESSRTDIQQSESLSADQKRELAAMFDSLKRVQSSFPAGGGAGASAGPRFEMPFSTAESAVTSGTERKYNGYSHAFAGMGVQFILFMGIELGMGMLLARRLGLWKRLRAAPLSRATLLSARIVSGAMIAGLLLLTIFAVAIAVFGVRIDGSAIGFAGIAIAFGILTASFGLLIAALGKTPEATRGLAIFATLILVMLGGAWVPSFVFPEWLQTVSLATPTRWAVDGLDAMTWRGLGLDAAIAPIGAMLAFSLLFAAIAVWRFDWEE